MPAGADTFPELRNANIDGNYQNAVAATSEELPEETIPSEVE